jgi:hypothetical protein
VVPLAAVDGAAAAAARVKFNIILLWLSPQGRIQLPLVPEALAKAMMDLRAVILFLAQSQPWEADRALQRVMAMPVAAAVPLEVVHIQAGLVIQPAQAELPLSETAEAILRLR